MTAPALIRTVAVVGDGIVGASAAAALKRKLPYLDVTLVASPPAADALAERIGSTLPSILGFHADLGLRDQDAHVQARCGVRLGTLFEDWNGAGSSYVHGYAQHGRPIAATPFHQQWLRLSAAGSPPPFDALSIAAALGRAGRFAPEALEADDFGLTLDLPYYRGMIRAYAQHLGVGIRTAAVADTLLREDGFVDALLLDDGSRLAADLFVDCTGPAALIRARLDDRFVDWSEWLPCDRILFGESRPDPNLPLLDRISAAAAGWLWRSPALARTSHGYAYSSAYAGDGEAERALSEAGAEAISGAVTLRQGRRPQPWLRNCVAIGDAAVSVEPLEWTNLHLAHSGIDRMVALMPGRDCDPLELAEYNRQSEAEADRIRDFLLLHYSASNRPESFWQAARARALPDSLRHSLDLFRERGRLPHYEEETFARDDWYAVLLGQGVIPRRIDPLAEAVPLAQVRAETDRLAASIAARAQAAPTQGAFLNSLMRQFAR